MFLPLSRYRATSPILIGLSLAATLVQNFFTEGHGAAVWVNYGAAVLFAVCVHDLIDRHHLGRPSLNHAWTVGIVLFASMTNARLCTGATDMPYWQVLAATGGWLLILMLLLHTWQNRSAPVPYLCIGLILGFLSALLPHLLYGLFIVPVALYFMRGFSGRNFWSGITGVLFGIWLVYLGVYFGVSPDVADDLLRQYAGLGHFTWIDLAAYSSWQLVGMGFQALLIVHYSFSSFFLNVGDSVRAHSCISLISTLSLIIAALALCDPTYLAIYQSLITLLLVMQISIYQANQQTPAGESGATLLLLLALAQSVVPLFVAF